MLDRAVRHVPGTEARLLTLPDELFVDSLCSGTGNFEDAMAVACSSIANKVHKTQEAGVRKP